MDLRAKLAILGLFALLGAFVGNEIGWAWVGLLWAFTAITTATAITIDSDLYCPRLRKLFLPSRAGSLYRRLLWKPAHWPRDWRMYDKALLIAVVYPILLPLLFWVWNGNAVRVGGLEILPAEPSEWSRGLVLGEVVLMLVAILPIKRFFVFARTVVLSKLSTQRAKVIETLILRGALVAAFAVAVFVVSGAVFIMAIGAFVNDDGVIESAVAGTIAIGVVVSFSGALAGSGAVAGAFAATVAVVVGFAYAGLGFVSVTAAGAFAVTVFSITFPRFDADWRNPGYFIMTFVLLASLFFACVNLGRITKVEVAQVLLFLGFLPLINALFDYASYYLTFGLLRDGLKASLPKRLAFALLDLLTAFALFALLGWAIVLVLHLANLAHGSPIYPLPALFQNLRENPQGNLWLAGMLFSTLVPTVLHGCIVCFSLGGVVTPHWRARLCHGIDSQDPAEQTLTMFGIGAYFTLSLLAPFAFLWGLYALFRMVTPYPFQAYLDMAENFARALGAMP